MRNPGSGDGSTHGWVSTVGANELHCWSCLHVRISQIKSNCTWLSADTSQTQVGSVWLVSSRSDALFCWYFQLFCLVWRCHQLRLTVFTRLFWGGLKKLNIKPRNYTWMSFMKLLCGLWENWCRLRSYFTGR